MAATSDERPWARAVPAPVADLVAAAGDLLLGAACPGCLRPGLGLCRACRVLLSERAAGTAEPSPSPPGFPTCFSTGPYDALVRALLAAYKEHQALLLGPVLGDLLADAVAPLLVSRAPVVLVPVPSSPAAVRRRGLDATLTLARRAARRLRYEGYEVTARSRLGLLRPVADQSGLGTAARRRNVAGAYAVRSGRLGPGRRAQVVVVDDLLTTGSSVAEASRALRAAGLEVLGAAVVAATERTGVKPERSV